jgi:hypothetical protein
MNVQGPRGLLTLAFLFGAAAAQHGLCAQAAPPSAATVAQAECRWAPGVYKLGEPVPLAILLPLDASDFFLTGLPAVGSEWASGRVREVKQEKPPSYPGTLEITLTVQLFAVGEVALPPVLVSVNTAEGAKTYQAEPPPVKIQPSLEEKADAPPPAQVLPFPAPGPWGWVIAGMVLCAALAAGAAWLLKRLRKGPALPPAPQVADPDAWIRREVERLLAGGVEPAFRYGALSRSLREYLEIKTGLPFPDWTTAEIRLGLDPVRRLDGEPGRGLVQVLALCDQVKFARYAPPADEEALVRPRVATLLEALRRPEPAQPREAA